MDFDVYRKKIKGIIFNISTKTDLILKSFSEKYNLTAIQYKILSKIYDDNSTTIGKLSNILKMDAGNMSSMCKKLENNGFISRSRRKDDERIVEVSLTDKGTKIVENVNKILVEKYRLYLKDEKNDDLNVLKNNLTKMDLFLDKIIESIESKD